MELWIAMGAGQITKNKAAFHALLQQREAIETDFGAELEWQELPEGDGSRIRYVLPGGYKSPPDQWPTIYERLVSAMVRLDAAMRNRVAALKL